MSDKMFSKFRKSLKRKDTKDPEIMEQAYAEGRLAGETGVAKDLSKDKNNTSNNKILDQAYAEGHSKGRGTTSPSPSSPSTPQALSPRLNDNSSDKAKSIVTSGSGSGRVIASNKMGKVLTSPPKVSRRPVDKAPPGDYANEKLPMDDSLVNENSIYSNTHPTYGDDAATKSGTGYFYDPIDTQGGVYGAMANQNDHSNVNPHSDATRAHLDRELNLKTVPSAYQEQEKQRQQEEKEMEKQKQKEKEEHDQQVRHKQEHAAEMAAVGGGGGDGDDSSETKNLGPQEIHNKNKSLYNPEGITTGQKEWNDDPSPDITMDPEESQGSVSMRGAGAAGAGAAAGAAAGAGGAAMYGSGDKAEKTGNKAEASGKSGKSGAKSGAKSGPESKTTGAAAGPGSAGVPPSSSQFDYDKEMNRLDKNQASTESQLNDLQGDKASDKASNTSNSSDNTAKVGVVGGLAAGAAGAAALAKSYFTGKSEHSEVNESYQAGVISAAYDAGKEAAHNEKNAPKTLDPKDKSKDLDSSSKDLDSESNSESKSSPGLFGGALGAVGAAGAVVTGTVMGSKPRQAETKDEQMVVNGAYEAGKNKATKEHFNQLNEENEAKDKEAKDKEVKDKEAAAASAATAKAPTTTTTSKSPNETGSDVSGIAGAGIVGAGAAGAAAAAATSVPDAKKSDSKSDSSSNDLAKSESPQASDRLVVEVIGIDDKKAAAKLAKQASKELKAKGVDLSSGKLVVNSETKEVYKLQEDETMTGATSIGSPQPVSSSVFDEKAGTENAGKQKDDKHSVSPGAFVSLKSAVSEHDRAKERLSAAAGHKEPEKDSGSGAGAGAAVGAGVGAIGAGTAYAGLHDSKDSKSKELPKESNKGLGGAGGGAIDKDSSTDSGADDIVVTVQGPVDDKEAGKIANDVVDSLKSNPKVLKSVKEIRIDSATGIVRDENGNVVISDPKFAMDSNSKSANSKAHEAAMVVGAAGAAGVVAAVEEKALDKKSLGTKDDKDDSKSTKSSKSRGLGSLFRRKGKKTDDDTKTSKAAETSTSTGKGSEKGSKASENLPVDDKTSSVYASNSSSSIVEPVTPKKLDESYYGYNSNPKSEGVSGGGGGATAAAGAAGAAGGPHGQQPRNNPQPQQPYYQQGPAYGGYPPQGYGGYPPQGYGGYPPQGYGGYPPQFQQQHPPQKSGGFGGGGMMPGLMMGAGAGLLGGMAINSMQDHAYEDGYQDAAGDFGGGDFGGDF